MIRVVEGEVDCIPQLLELLVLAVCNTQVLLASEAYCIKVPLVVLTLLVILLVRVLVESSMSHGVEHDLGI